MQLSKEEFARQRIHNGSSVQIENSISRITVLRHSTSLVLPNSFPRDGIFNQHLTTIKDSYILILFNLDLKYWFIIMFGVWMQSFTRNN